LLRRLAAGLALLLLLPLLLLTLALRELPLASLRRLGAAKQGDTVQSSK
jgi:hypothetical protein